MAVDALVFSYHHVLKAKSLRSMQGGHAGVFDLSFASKVTNLQTLLKLVGNSYVEMSL